MALRWYVVHAYSGFEHQVSRSLKDRALRAGMQDKFGQVLVPSGPKARVQQTWLRPQPRERS